MTTDGVPLSVLILEYGRRSADYGLLGRSATLEQIADARRAIEAHVASLTEQRDAASGALEEVKARYVVDTSSLRAVAEKQESELVAARAEVERLKADNEHCEMSNEALLDKVQSLSAHETCGCSFDTKDFCCMHHSPQLVAARADVERLGKFAGKAIQTMHIDYLGCDWDGGDVQDALEECGLLAAHEATKPCDWDDCGCAEFPTTCYLPTELGQRCLAAARAEQPENG